MTRNPSFILGRMLTHIEVLERAHDHASIGCLRRLHDDLKASFLEDDLRASIAMVDRKRCAEVGAEIVPFPQNINVQNDKHLTAVSKRSHTAHLGAEEGA